MLKAGCLLAALAAAVSYGTVCSRRPPAPPPASQPGANHLPRPADQPSLPILEGGREPTDQAVDFVRPYEPMIDPPAAGGPPIPDGNQPTAYATASVGQRLVVRIYPLHGEPYTRSSEVTAITSDRINITQSVQRPGEPPLLSELNLPRYRPLPPQTDASPPGQVQRTVELLRVNGRTLLCRVHQSRQGSIRYRDWRCPDLFNQVVKHADTASGDWQTRLEVIDFSD
jgi:hypothetical protein